MPRVKPTESRILSCTPCRESKLKCLPAGPTSRLCRRCVTKGLECTKETSKRLFTNKEWKSKRNNESLTGTSTNTRSQTPQWMSSQLLERSRSSERSEDGGGGSGSNTITSNSNSHHHHHHHHHNKKNNVTTDSGFPSLSNPTKLIAQASEDMEQETIFSALGATPRVDQQASEVAKAVATSDVAKWRAFFSAGIYTPRIEGRGGNDPIACGILSASRAAALFHTYMDQYNDGNVLLDPIMHTFEYVSAHSFLSSALYVIVAGQEKFEGAEEMSERLDNHIMNKLLPLIVLKGYRSVEIVIGLVALATFHFSTQYIFDDHSWALLGLAIRIGTELDLNSRIVSRALTDSDEKAIRHYRSQERTWMNVHLTAQAFASQTGRRPFLCPEGVVEESENWHLGKYAVKTDAAIVARIQLRHVYHTHRLLFDRLCNTYMANGVEKGSASGLMERDMIYFLNRSQEELRRWYDRFCDIEPTNLPASRLRLYLNHTKVMLFSMPLQKTTGDIESFRPAIMSLYEATTAYLEELNGSNPLHRLGRGHNSIFINGCYVAVMALKLTTLSSKLTWIDVDYLFSLAKRTSILFGNEGRGPRHKKGCSEAYGEYLQWLLSRYQDQSSSSSASAIHHTHPTTIAAATNNAASQGNPAYMPSWPSSSITLPSRSSPDACQVPPVFVLPGNLENGGQVDDSMTELWGDHVAFSDDNNFYTWAQRFFNDQQGETIANVF